MASKETPLMRQYNQIKSKHPDTILLFRLGDFFEAFGDDAAITAAVCGIVLTKRNSGSEESTPLAGFPHHQLDNYLPKLVRAGHKVAVCEQLEDPKLARGIVRRGVVEVVTPGVSLYEKMLDARSNTFLVGVSIADDKTRGRIAGIAFADASTGEFSTCEVSFSDLFSTIETLAPAEILLPKSLVAELLPLFEKLSCKPAISRREDWIFEFSFGYELLVRHFKTPSLKGFGIENTTVAITAAGAVLNYISESQMGKIDHVRSIRLYNPSDYMMLDVSTRRNMELLFSMNETSPKASLLTVLDETRTPMGARLLKQWLVRPLRSHEKIHSRLASIRWLLQHRESHSQLRDVLGRISDLERLISKVCTLRATTRDVLTLCQSLETIPALKQLLESVPQDDSSVLQQACKRLDPCIAVVTSIRSALIDEPSLQFGTGNIFRQGYSPELDEITEAMFSGKNWISSYQDSLRASTGIPSLKVGFNNVFGYYIEVSNAHLTKVPDTFTRKQTMTNGERYSTPELKDIESKILTAEERINDVEQRLFQDIRAGIAEFASQIQTNAYVIAGIDCIQSFAYVAHNRSYVEPVITSNHTLSIRNGRHPVVETLLPVGDTFVANSTFADCATEQIHIITGPNMAGKSCYLRQVGLITLMAHCGSYVPAEHASIPLTDRIFTRVGAQDNISSGESTFLVEMQEAANIVNNATIDSLILLDEVGRGTATFDGISIAWALVEYLHDIIGAKTLFATHYHELNDLATLLERVCAYHVQVQEIDSTIIFKRTVAKGSTDHSFGIHVAQMAGLPPQLTNRAAEILKRLEESNSQRQTALEDGSIPSARRVATHAINANDAQSNGVSQLAIFTVQDDAIRAKLKDITVNNLTPLQALSILSELQAMI